MIFADDQDRRGPQQPASGPADSAPFGASTPPGAADDFGPQWSSDFGPGSAPSRQAPSRRAAGFSILRLVTGILPLIVFGIVAVMMYRMSSAGGGPGFPPMVFFIFGVLLVMSLLRLIRGFLRK